MDGLTHADIFKQKLRGCEPIELSRFVVGLRERHLHYWTPFSDTHPRECNSKRLTFHEWCALPFKRAKVTQSPYSLPKYMFLDLPQDVIRSVARFRLRVYTLRYETATWNPGSPPNCDLCEADDDIQDEQHDNNKLYFFLSDLLVFYEQVSVLVIRKSPAKHLKHRPRMGECFHKSKNFTADNEIRMPPTVPLNHYSNLTDQQDKPESYRVNPC
eukprot:636343-Pelagomonas_calceolata.AAC.1